MMYINGLANISPQPTLGKSDFLGEPVGYQTNMLQCIEPDYNDFFHPNTLRRTGRVLRLGWAAAKMCLDDAEKDAPDSICVGTGKGCFKNTHVFLESIIQNDEQFVPPSPFIQSAHSSIAAQIAIQTGCRNYNMTYSHRSFSFEAALLDARLLLDEGQFTNMLVGGVDEIEEIQFRTFDRIGHYKSPFTKNFELLNTKSKGTIAGEGSTFFLVESVKNEHTYAFIKAIQTYSNPADNAANQTVIRNFLENKQMDGQQIDLVLFGLNGDDQFDHIYYKVMQLFNANNTFGYFKHLCGEYHTSSAFALWMASMILKYQKIPKTILLNNKNHKPIQNILIYNQYRNRNHSLILVSNK